MSTKTFKVDICETRKKAIQVQASSFEEAHRMAQAQWAQGHLRLTDEDVTEVYLTVHQLQRDRSYER